jgi:hypothetical protein
MCGINPQAHLADVLSRIADHPIRQIDTRSLAMVKTLARAKSMGGWVTSP